MITVYVWSFRGKNDAWGHASLDCRGSYISYWPSAGGRVPALASRAAEAVLGNSAPQALRSIYSADPIRNRTLADDVEAERQAADHRVALAGLDEVALLRWWQSFGLDGGRLQGPQQPWHTLERNCSTVVAMALRAAGGDQHAAWQHSWNLVWHPEDVRRYAESIREGLAKASR